MDNKIKKNVLLANLKRNRNTFVPIIGDDCFVVQKENGGEIVLNEYLIDKFCTEKNIDRSILHGKYGYDTFSTIQNNLKKEDADSFEDTYITYVNDLENKGILHLKSSILRFLECGDFPLILTTHTFDTIEKLLEQKMMRYTSLCHNWGQADETNIYKLSENQRCIYHLFGEYSNNWVYDDKSLLSCLYSHQNQKNSLNQYLSNRHLLVLGCNLPNWVFRFLWYPITNARNPQYPQKTDGAWCNSMDVDESLDDFLNDIRYLRDNDYQTFLDDIIHALSEEKNDEDTNYEYDIFLSYKAEDKDVAIKIREFLQQKGLKVWQDLERESGNIQQGGEYWKRIKLGIQRSRFYMPLLTRNYYRRWLEWNKTKKTLDAAGNADGVINETKMVLEWKSKKEYLWTKKSKDGILVYELPIVDLEFEDIISLGVDTLFPKELFKDKQLYYYSEKGDNQRDTFHTHTWEDYKIVKENIEK